VEEVRRAAVEGLAKIAEKGDEIWKTAVFRARLSDSSADVKLAALGLLASWVEPGDKCTVEAVCTCVGDGDAKVRTSALELLEKLVEAGDEIAVADVSVHLKHARADVRLTALVALAHVVEKVEKEKGNGRVVIDTISSCLGDADGRVRRLAVELLGEMSAKGETSATAEVMRHLQHERADVRLAAVKAFAQAAEGKEKGDARTVEALSGCLGDEDESVRRMAVLALAQVAEEGHRGTIAAVCAHLEDEDVLVRRAVVSVLPHLAGANHEHAARLVQARTEHANAGVRSVATEALKVLGVSEEGGSRRSSGGAAGSRGTPPVSGLRGCEAEAESGAWKISGKAPAAVAHKEEEKDEEDAEALGGGTLWQVIGGDQQGGIIVRKGEDTRWRATPL